MRIKRGSWLKMKVNDVLKRNDGIDTEKKKLAFLIDAGIKTNIHYVLSKNNLEEACMILR